MNKYIAQFVGIAKIVYAYNLDQAFQEADYFADKRNLKKHSLIDLGEFVQSPPYFGIYQKIIK